MAEKRKHPRTDLNEPGYVSSGGSVMSCVVRNISLEGAAIDVDIGLVSLDFGLTTVSSCFLIWPEIVRDQPVPTF
jgi:PilZ domain